MGRYGATRPTVLMLFLMVLTLCVPVHARDEATPFVLVITGTELLSGKFQDGHTPFITRTLEPLGTRCVASLIVGDTRKDLLDALRYAVQHAPLVITTGGLGPTDDDVTRETLSEFTGMALHEHPDVLGAMARRFNTPVEGLRANLRRQTQTPVQGSYLENDNGSAVGLVFDDGKQVIVALPGPPRELQPMVMNRLIPFLARRFGTHTIGCSLQLRFVGIGESVIDQTMHQHLQLPPDLILSSLFEQSRVDLTLSFAEDTAENKSRLRGLEKELLGYIQDYFYADDGSTLEMHVLNRLAQEGQTLAVAEVGSGGALAAALADAPNAKNVFLGGCVAPSHRSMAILLNDPDSAALTQGEPETLTREMAMRIAEHVGSQWAVAVSQVQQDEKGPRYVWVAAGAAASGFQTRRMDARGQGVAAQQRLVTDILDILRKQLYQIYPSKGDLHDEVQH